MLRGLRLLGGFAGAYQETMTAMTIMLAAAIYPPRTASPAAVFLIPADGLLVKELFSFACRKHLIALSAVLFAVTAYNCVCGAVDIASVYAQYKANVNTNNERIAAGDIDRKEKRIAGQMSGVFLFLLSIPVF